MRYLKQYGERRTGTNYLRTLLLVNVRDVVPLMHVLGDKHSPPVDLEACWESHRDSDDPEWRFVWSATYTAPAESTRQNDVAQVRYLRSLAVPVARAVEARHVGFVISIKEPIAWAVSLAKYSGWLVWVDGELRMHSRFAANLKAACEAFNANYRAWLALHARFGERSLIVRHEDLLDRAPDVLEAIVERFDLERAPGGWRFPEGATVAADWDHCAPAMYGVRFDPGFYRRRDYLRRLSPPLLEIVRETIDWDLMAMFGYSVVGSR
jgi:hypothetical protein